MCSFIKEAWLSEVCGLVSALESNHCRVHWIVYAFVCIPPDTGGSASTNAVETNKQTIPIRFFIIIPSDFRKYGLLLVYEEQHISVMYIQKQ